MIFFRKEHILDHLCKVSSDFKTFCQVTIIHPRFPQIPNHGLSHETIGEIWKTCKNEFDWLKMIFFRKEDILDHLCKVSSDFKTFCQVTIIHPRFPQIPNHGLSHETIGEIWKTCKNEFDWLKMIFFRKEHILDHLCKVSSDFKTFCQVTIIHPRFPQIPNHGLSHETIGEIWKTCKNEVDWLKMIFFRKEHILDHLCKVSSDFKTFCQVTIIHPRFPQIPNHGLSHETIGEILKTCKNEFDWLKMIFFIKENIFHHFCKVSSDFKTLCQISIFHPACSLDLKTSKLPLTPNG